MNGGKKLDVEVVIEQVVRRLSELLPEWKRRSPVLADQAERAMTSVWFNVGESIHNTRGHRLERLETASGSASELRRAVRYAQVHGWIGEDDAARTDDELDRTLAMLWRMRERAASDMPVRRRAR